MGGVQTTTAVLINEAQRAKASQPLDRHALGELTPALQFPQVQKRGQWETDGSLDFNDGT